MIQREFEADNLYARCRDAVAQVLMRHDWRLIEREQFIAQVVACVQAGEVAEPRPAAVNIYCRRLYAACRGDEGSAAQERAFVELHRYLYELSYRELSDIPYDLRLERVNEALMRIWQRLSAYRTPGAFLAIAAMELRNALRPWWRRPHAQREQLPWELPPTSLASAGEGPAEPEEHDPLARVLNEELAQRVRACFDEALQRYPRARQQLEAVWLKFIVGLDDKAIGAYLEKPVAAVHVLRSRGLSRLREEPAWQLLARDLDIQC